MAKCLATFKSMGIHMRKPMQSLLGVACLVLAVQAAQAVPINYSFSGTSVGEVSGSGAPVATKIY